jgi:DNA-binding TFAR19-related protein (PDSD5 family)
VHEGEESQLLEAVAREQLEKIQHTRKDLAGNVVICKVWRLAVAL